MRCHALACDYDGTLATHGRVEDECLDALERFRASGRKLIMVTGREVDDLLSVFPHSTLFDRIVAENGGILFRPEGQEEKALCRPPPKEFLDLLREWGVSHDAGRVIVATREPNHIPVIQAIQDLGLELQVIFNKGAAMVLPSGVNKATGLLAALDELGLSPRFTVGAGDAENDQAFLDLCQFSVAVANAIPLLKNRTDYVTWGERGAGITELIGNILSGELKGLGSKTRRRRLTLGTREDG